MKLLYTEEEYNNAKSTDELPCQCYQCSNTFYTMKKSINYESKNKRGRVKYCSQKCNNDANNQQDRIIVNCANCNSTVERVLTELKRSKSGNHFCCKSCAVTYNNKHKTTGTRRSKLEVWDLV